MEALSIAEDSGDAFIRRIDVTDGWPDDSTIVRSACLYDATRYDESLFRTLGIAKPEQLQRAVTKRKAEFLAGRYCALQALELTGFPGFHIGIGSHRQPIWPDGICGAISHAHQLAVAVVAHDADVYGVGVDVEEELTADAIVQIQSFVLNADERLLLSSVPLRREQLITLIYSIKESFFKAAFPLVQRYFDFDAISLLKIDVSKGECYFQINTSLHPMLWQGRRLKGRFSFPQIQGLDTCQVATLVVLARA